MLSMWQHSLRGGLLSNDFLVQDPSPEMGSQNELPNFWAQKARPFLVSESESKNGLAF
jgi:hypothetical protein